LGPTGGAFLVLACFLALVFLVLLPAFAMWLSMGGEAMDDRRDCCTASFNDNCIASAIQEGTSRVLHSRWVLNSADAGERRTVCDTTTLMTHHASLDGATPVGQCRAVAVGRGGGGPVGGLLAVQLRGEVDLARERLIMAQSNK
jgi:hypothetical protein